MVDIENRRAYHRAYYHDNKEKLKSYLVTYREVNRDKAAAYRAAHREKATAYAKEYYITNKDNPNSVWGKGQENHLRRAYGLTPEQFEKMWDDQGGKCYLCDLVLIRGKKTHVDHDHETGMVRSILCNECNHLIGNCHERIDVLERAAKYLRRFKLT